MGCPDPRKRAHLGRHGTPNSTGGAIGLLRPERHVGLGQAAVAAAIRLRIDRECRKSNDARIMPAARRHFGVQVTRKTISLILTVAYSENVALKPRSHAIGTQLREGGYTKWACNCRRINDLQGPQSELT